MQPEIYHRANNMLDSGNTEYKFFLQNKKDKLMLHEKLLWDTTVVSESENSVDKQRIIECVHLNYQKIQTLYHPLIIHRTKNAYEKMIHEKMTTNDNLYMPWFCPWESLTPFQQNNTIMYLFQKQRHGICRTAHEYFDQLEDTIDFTAMTTDFIDFLEEHFSETVCRKFDIKWLSEMFAFSIPGSDDVGFYYKYRGTPKRTIQYVITDDGILPLPVTQAAETCTRITEYERQ